MGLLHASGVNILPPHATEESKGEKVVALTISKTNQMEWWNCVVVGDSTIDTTKV